MLKEEVQGEKEGRASHDINEKLAGVSHGHAEGLPTTGQVVGHGFQRGARCLQRRRHSRRHEQLRRLLGLPRLAHPSARVAVTAVPTAAPLAGPLGVAVVPATLLLAVGTAATTAS